MQSQEIELPVEAIQAIQQLPFEQLGATYEQFELAYGKAGRRWLCRHDRYYLLTMVLHRIDALDPWLYARCREVEAAPDGHLDLWAREHYKSTIITFAGAIQEIVRDPDITIGVFSHTRRVAVKFLRQIKLELETNQDLKNAFPEIFWQNPKGDAPRWSDDTGLVMQRSTNPKESTLEAWGLVDGQPTSAHFKLRIYDDVVTRESVSTPEQVNKTTEAWELSAQKDIKYYKRKNAPASAEQLLEFDTIAKQLLDGQSLTTSYRATNPNAIVKRHGSISGRATNDALEKLSAIYKDVRGRSGFDSTNNHGVMDYLRGAMSRYNGRLQLLEEAQQGEKKVKQIPTDFAMNAKELDQGRGSDYWTTPHEMAARAFQGYVEDKVAEKGGKSPFLNYGKENAGILTPWGFKYPFPRGEERKAINSAFDKFVAEIQSKDTDTGIALFNRKGNDEKSAIDKASLDVIVTKVTSTQPNGKAIVTVAKFSDLPAAITQYADKTGYDNKTEKIPSVVYQDKIYLVQENIHSALEAEESLLHERIHDVLRSQGQDALVDAMNVLYERLGKGEGLLTLANKVGYSFDNYRTQAANLPERERIALYVDEFLAGVEGKRAYNKLSARAINLMREFWGKVRAWLQDNGFVNLANKVGVELKQFTRSDLAYLLKQIRNTTPSDTAIDTNDIRYSRPAAPTFYSALARAIPQAKQDAMPAAQWKNWLVANAGKLNVKQAELQWSGVTDWLAMQQGKVSKADIQAYLEANGVQVSETVLNANANSTFEFRLNDGGDAFNILMDGDVIEIVDNADDALNRIGELRKNPTKYEKYTVAGGGNYKELLLTLPENKGISDIKQRNDGAWIIEVNGAQFGTPYPDEHSARVAAALDIPKIRSEREKANFRSSHFNQPNILAHIRFDERTDADVNKVLFINEIQSDWGQKGRKDGFKPSDAELQAMKGYELAVKTNQLNKDWREDRTDKEYQDAGWAYIDATKQAEGITDADIAAAQKAIQNYQNGLRAAPFVTDTKAWVALAIKRMVRYAAENGFDKVAFVTGEQAANLYDLSKQVDSIDWYYESKEKQDKLLGEGYNVIAKKSDNPVLQKYRLSETELENIVGKEIAKKIIEAKTTGKENGSLEGVDLKVGGKGMNAFYDKIVPQVASDVLKSLGGGKLELMNLQTQQLGFTITPEMRAVAMEGQPLFSRPQSRFTEAAAKGITIDIRDLKAVVANVTEKLKGLPETHVLEDYTHAPAELLADIEHDQAYTAAGAWHNGEIYLFRNNIFSTNHALFTLLHESTHEGLRRIFGKGIDSTLMGIYLSNPSIKKQADALRKQHQDLSLVASVEEALADMGGHGIHASVMDKLVAFVRNALRKIGMNLSITDGEIRSLVTRALDSVRSPSKVTHFTIGSAYSNQGESVVRTRGIPDSVSRVIADYSNDQTMKRHPDYNAAKAGSIEAADRLAMDMVKTETISKAQQNFGSDVIYLPVLTKEAQGNNKIPLAMAARYALATNAKMTDSVQQINKAFHTGANAMERLLARAEFSGEVIAGAKYVMIDDVTTMGSTFADLANYIQTKGGHVVGAVTMTNASRSDTLTPDTFTIKRLEAQYGDQIRQLFSVEPATLTNDEARYLVGFRTADELGARAAKARYERVQRISSKTLSKPQDRLNTDDTAYSRLYQVTPDQEQALKNVGAIIAPKTIGQWFTDKKIEYTQNLAQKVADQFAPLRNLDMHAYVLARMSKSYDGAMEALLNFGNIYVDAQGANNTDVTKGTSFIKSLQRLQGEQQRFFWWIAANRAEQLSAESREHLFSGADIAALKTLNTGNLPDGQDRTAIYKEVLAEYTNVSKSVLDAAEASGIINGESRAIWEKEFYVPFYRALEDGISSPNIGSKTGLVRQYAFKKLKGGSEKIHHDLMANVMLNWTHLIAASGRNRAAQATLQAGEKAGIATPLPEAQKGSVFYLDDGQQKHYMVDDPTVLDAITSLEYAGLGGGAMRVLSGFKRALTYGVTFNPAFKIRNIIRDTLSAIAINDISYNPAKTLKQGVGIMRDKESQTYASLLAGGGIIRFGTMLEGNSSIHLNRLINAGVDMNNIIDTKEKAMDMLTKATDWYNEMGDISEGANRAALYQQLRNKGVSHLDASYQARDMLDFTMGGTSGAIRFLVQTVPFMNARIQGLYKLGRAGKANPQRMAAVVAATALASIMLMLAFQGDDDWKKREDWDRDNYWWFKIGGTAYRIPKPFEIGTIATLAERGLEYLTDDEMTNQRLWERIQFAVSQTLAFNPVPQLFKPAIDVYSNTDSFTGRPIETMGMERLQKQDRVTRNTSELARGLGVVGQYADLSPVQIDHLVRGYFGWLGIAGNTVVDAVASTVIDRPEKPRKQLKDMFLVGNFAESLPSNQSRYLTQFYEQSKEIEQAYASWRAKIKEHDVEGARAFKEDNAEQIGQYHRVERQKKLLTNINTRINQVYNSGLDADTKREKLNVLNTRKAQLAEQVARKIN